MTLKTAAGDDIVLHPALVKLAADGWPDVVALSGFLGPSSRDGHVTLYRSLRNLDRSVEIQSSDILHMEAIPESVVPYGATTVWIRKDADLAHRTASIRRAELAEPDQSFVESKAGRLRMRRRAEVESSDCTSWCQYLCSSHCLVSSHCDLTPEVR